MKLAERWRPAEVWRSAHSVTQRSDPIQPKIHAVEVHQDLFTVYGTHKIAPPGHHLLERCDYTLRHCFREQRIKFRGIQLIRYGSPDCNPLGHPGGIPDAAGEHLADRFVDAVGASSEE